MRVFFLYHIRGCGINREESFKKLLGTILKQISYASCYDAHKPPKERLCFAVSIIIFFCSSVFSHIKNRNVVIIYIYFPIKQTVSFLFLKEQR